MTTPSRISQQAEALRKIADLIESGQTAVTPNLKINLWHPNSSTEMANVARSAMKFGGRAEKDVSHDMYNLRIHFGPVEVSALAMREEVCQRIVVGTREVVRMVKDPEAMKKLPDVEIIEHEDVVEWECSPLLSENGS